MSVSADIANAEVSLTGITSYTLFRLRGNASDEGEVACKGMQALVSATRPWSPHSNQSGWHNCAKDAAVSV